MGPIKTELVTFKKSDLFHNRLLIAIDSGCSLTKILFLNKRDHAQFLNKGQKSIVLEFSIFQNGDFEEALERIKLHAYLKEDDVCKIHITGTFASSNREKIKSILNKDVVYLDLLMSKKVGLRVALEYIGIENMIVKDVDARDHKMIIINEMFNKLVEVWKSKLETDDKSTLYPCLFNVHGSVSRYIYFDENQNAEDFGLINDGGKGFLGLAKCILDVNNYNEIMDLASQGDVCNINTLLKEMIDENIDSPYTKFPPDLPIFPFGKCIDFNKGREDFKKEDLAKSLISLYILQIILTSVSLCFIKKMSRIYLVGNIFLSDLFQEELKKNLSTFPIVVKFIILNCGYSGALGAMVQD